MSRQVSPRTVGSRRNSSTHSRRRRGGRGGGRPPIRFKTSKIRANGLFIWANSLNIWAHHCQNTVSVSVQTFFFFFFRRTPSFFFFFFWRTPQFGQKKPSQFWQRNAMRQAIFREKVCCPPKSFWAPTAMLQPILRVEIPPQLIMLAIVKQLRLLTYSPKLGMKWFAT